MSIEIEQGVPLERMKLTHTRKSKYPFDELKPGESFFIPITKRNPKPWFSFWSQVRWARGRFPDKTFTLKKNEDKVQGIGARIWRLT